MDAEKLTKDIYEKIDNWDERSQFTLAGIKNLSMSDLETLIMFCNEYKKYGSLRGYWVNKPMKTILEKYGWMGE